MYHFIILQLYRIASQEPAIITQAVIVAGTAMNSGKTHTAASLVRGLKKNRLRVAGIKATGTGSGVDLWKMKDMGADVVLDFTDAGFSSTYKIPDESIAAGVLMLLSDAARRKCDFAVVEIADGLHHVETAKLLRSERLRSLANGVVFAAYDSLGALTGYQELCKLGYNVLAISGQVTRAPLAMRETQAAVSGCPIYTPFELQAGALIPAMTDMTDNDLVDRLVYPPNARKTPEPENTLSEFELLRENRLHRRYTDDSHYLAFPENF